MSRKLARLCLSGIAAGLSLVAFGVITIDAEAAQPEPEPKAAPPEMADLHLESFVLRSFAPVQEVTKDKLAVWVTNMDRTGILSDPRWHLETHKAGDALEGTHCVYTSFAVQEMKLKNATVKILAMHLRNPVNGHEGVILALLDGRKPEPILLRPDERRGVDDLPMPPQTLALFSNGSASFLVEINEEFSYPPSSPEKYKALRMTNRWGVGLRRLSDGAEFAIPVTKRPF